MKKIYIFISSIIFISLLQANALRQGGSKISNALSRAWGIVKEDLFNIKGDLLPKKTTSFNIEPKEIKNLLQEGITHELKNELKSVAESKNISKMLAGIGGLGLATQWIVDEKAKQHEQALEKVQAISEKAYLEYENALNNMLQNTKNPEFLNMTVQKRHDWLNALMNLHVTKARESYKDYENLHGIITNIREQQDPNRILHHLNAEMANLPTNQRLRQFLKNI